MIATIKVWAVAFLFIFGSFSAAIATEVPSSFTYQGRLYAADGVTPLASNVDLKLQIFDPTATCLLYEESQTNIALSDGLFSVSVGSSVGSSKRELNDPGLSMAVIFANEPIVIRTATSNNCSAGYTPVSGDKRKLKVTVYNHTSGESTVLTPLQELSMSPYSMVANKSGDTSKFGGKSASEYIQVEGASVTQVKVKQLTDNVTGILNLLTGNISVSDTPSAATSAVNKTYVDSKVASVTPNASCVSGSFNRWNGTAWVCEVDQNSGGGGFGTAAYLNAPIAGNAGVAEVVKGSDSRLTDARVTIDNSVSSVKIVDGAVTNGKIAEGAVGTTKIVDSAITTNKLSDLSVSDAKISAVSAGKVTGELVLANIPVLDNTKLPATITKNVTGNLTGNVIGNIKLTDSATCDDTAAGTIKYAADGKFYGCKGTATGWVELGAAGGGTSSAPSPFAFSDVINAGFSQIVESSEIELNGFSGSLSASFYTGSSGSAQIAVSSDGGSTWSPWSSTASVSVLNKIKIRLTSSATLDSPVSARLKIGDYYAPNWTINQYCPSGYVAVPPLAPYTSANFCVAKYEMKNEGNVATSTAAGSPWGNISRGTDATTVGAAWKACKDIGANYDLISNNEWQTIARNIEGVASNWSGNAVGTGQLNRGHSDSSPSAGLGASADNDPYYGTGQSNADAWNGGIYVAGDEQKRTHTLNNNEVIWDFAGNLSEWIKDDRAALSFGGNGLSGHTGNSWEELDTVDPNKGIFGSENGYTSAKGTGQIYGGTLGGVIRGGSWDQPYVGIFLAYLGYAPTGPHPTFGFRCVFRP
jgi:hypothetical protein